MPSATSIKRMTLKQRYEELSKAIKRNNGKTSKSKSKKSSYTFTGQDANGLDGSYYHQH